MTWRHLARVALSLSLLIAAWLWFAGSSGPFRRSAPPPVVELKDEDLLLRRWVDSLGRGDDTEAARVERELLRHGEAAVSWLARLVEESPELATDVVRVLGRLRCTASVGALHGIHRAHGASQGGALRTAILRALAEIGGDTARDAFLALLRDEPDPDVRKTAAALAPALLRPEEVALLPPDLRGAAQGDAVHREDVAQLIADLSKTSASKRSSAEWALYLSPLCPLAGRMIVVERLEQRADDDAIAALRKASEGQDLDTAVAAFSALCRLRRHPVRLAVKEILVSAPEDRLPSLLDVLGTYGDSVYVPLAREIEAARDSERIKALARRAALRLELR